MNRQNIFTEVFDTNRWLSRNKETVSGNGSTLQVTENIRNFLPKLFKDLNIKSIYDVACGDFNWFKEIDLTGIDYIGGDIVPILIKNNRQYESANIRFLVADVCEDDLPIADLYICRDVFVHLSNEDIKKALDNIRGKYRYILITNFPSVKENVNIETGKWRATNSDIEPFNLGAKIKDIVEQEKGRDKRGNLHTKMISVYEL